MQTINVVITKREVRQLQEMSPQFFHDENGEIEIEQALRNAVHDLICTSAISFLLREDVS